MRQAVLDHNFSKIRLLLKSGVPAEEPENPVAETPRRTATLVETAERAGHAEIAELLRARGAIGVPPPGPPTGFAHPFGALRRKQALRCVAPLLQRVMRRHRMTRIAGPARA